MDKSCIHNRITAGAVTSIDGEYDAALGPETYK